MVVSLVVLMAESMAEMWGMMLVCCSVLQVVVLTVKTLAYQLVAKLGIQMVEN